MDLLIAWVVFPACLALACAGCGALACATLRLRPGAALTALLGFASVVVLGQFTTLLDATAELTLPVIAAAAATGLALRGRDLLRALRGEPLAGVGLVFAAYAAPVVLSGEATFAGYIKLDDTATWLALTDHLLDRGRDLSGLPPSSYEATIAFNLADGYPVGAFVPFGAAAHLIGMDPAWVIQPYMAFLAALLALALWFLAGTIVRGGWRRPAVAAIAAQPALLFGYFLWGGIKELAAAALLATAAAVLQYAASRRYSPRTVIALALPSAALVGVLSPAGLVWITPMLAAAAVLAWRLLGLRRASTRAAVFVGALAVLAAPVTAAGALLPPTASPLDDQSARGNLIAPLDPLQIAGIWPAGDFRLEPEEIGATNLLIALTLLAAGGGFVAAWRSRALGPPLYLASALAGALALVAVGSPWVEGKALAIASPALLFAALLGAAALAARGMWLQGIAIGALIAAGVLWSNLLAYRDVSLAPRAQLAELESIGEQLGEGGPVLMTEYQPYGVRHFLRDAAPEGASELRRRRLPLRKGGTLEKGLWDDTDAFRLSGLKAYDAFVLRRSPSQSRPPSNYALSETGTFYETWLRDPSRPVPIEHLSLGRGVATDAVPRCRAVTRLARLAGSEGALAAAPPQRAVFVAPEKVRVPAGWTSAPRPVPDGRGILHARVRLRSAGRYEIWLGGSVLAEAELRIDRRGVGAVRHQLNNTGLYAELATAGLAAGSHELAIEFSGSDLHPGSDGTPTAVGPIALSRAAARSEPTRYLEPGRAGALCGRRWDWIEALPNAPIDG